MEKTLHLLNEVQKQINSEIENYKKAIEDNKPFNEAKTIYLHIKELKNQSLELLEQANLKLENKK